MKHWAVIVAILHGALLVGPTRLVSAEPVFPGVNWERETNGLSPETVRGVDAFVHTLDTTGLMVVKNGRVVYEYGDVKRLSYLASTRKSVLSMLYGPYVASGKIRLDATLKDLGMSDVGGLLPIEERAKVIDLITARSGVYHPVTQGFGLMYELRFSSCPGAPTRRPRETTCPRHRNAAAKSRAPAGGTTTGISTRLARPLSG